MALLKYNPTGRGGLGELQNVASQQMKTLLQRRNCKANRGKKNVIRRQISSYRYLISQQLVSEVLSKTTLEII